MGGAEEADVRASTQWAIGSALGARQWLRADGRRPSAKGRSSQLRRHEDIAIKGERVIDRDQRRFHADGTLSYGIDRRRRFRLAPFAKAEQRSVGGNRRANAYAKGVEGGVTGGILFISAMKVWRHK